MHTPRKPTMREQVLSQGILLGAALSLVGCGGPIVFEGQTPVTIAGEPPPPPPPPPEPKEPPPRVVLKDNKIEIKEKVQFEYNSANIKQVSHGLLDEVAQVIKDNPHIKKVRVEGHASAEGNDQYNLRLSDRRAKAVRTYLVEEAEVEEDKLTAKGFGEEQPIADNDTEAGRKKNRRVEFNIVEQDVKKKKVKIDPETGEEKVVDEGDPGESKQQ